MRREGSTIWGFTKEGKQKCRYSKVVVKERLLLSIIIHVTSRYGTESSRLVMRVLRSSERTPRFDIWHPIWSPVNSLHIYPFSLTCSSVSPLYATLR